MKYLLIVLIAMFVLSGCAGKGLKVEVEIDGNNKTVNVETDYQIENGFKMTRNTKTGEYDIEFGSATTKDAETGFMIDMFKIMQDMMMRQALGISVPVDK